MVEHHVEHDVDAPFASFFDKIFEVFHRAVAGIELPVIGNIISIVPLRGNDHRIKPDIIDSQLVQIIQVFDHTAYISPAIMVRILK